MIATMLTTEGAENPDQLVGVAAGELFEWGWLAAELADWLDHADEPTRCRLQPVLPPQAQPRQDRGVPGADRRTHRRAARR